MQRPRHDVQQAAAMSSSRVAGLAIAGFINIIFVYALISGFGAQIIKAIPKAMEISILSTPDKPQQPITPPKTATVQPDNLATVAPPEIQVETETPPPTIAATTTSAQPVSDSAVSAVGSTHTIPPYPAEAKRLGQQGTVLLRLTISPSGDVTNAEVLQSSGVPLLDQTAAAWVMSHWKYKPAVQGGAAVATTTTAAVKFDLRKA